MYKLLVAEDEVAFRDGLLSMIDWRAHGIEVSGVASSGKEAWEAFRAEPPDLLLTDIRMPRLSGLELAERIVRSGYDAKIVLLTGHSDFHYAQQALKLGVFDYLLKPCSPQQVLDAMTRARRQLEEDRTRVRKLDRLEREWQENLRLRRDERLAAWLREGARSREEREAEAAELGLRLTGGPYVVAVFGFDTKELAYEERDLPLIRYAAANVMEETAEGRFPGGNEWLSLDERFVLIAGLPAGGTEERRLQETLRALQDNLSSFLKVSVSIGVGSAAPLERLHVSYREAVEALSRRFFHGARSIHYAAEPGGPAPDAAGSARFREQAAAFAEQGRALLAECRDADFALEADGWLSAFLTPELTLRGIHLHAYSLVDKLVRAAKARRGEGADRLVEELEACTERIGSCETFEELTALLTQALRAFVGHVNAGKPMHKTIRYVLQLIEEQYATNLTLKSIAEQVFMSPSHLSTLFRQETGVNFLDYLHQLRIEKAKPLLREESGKVYAVARQVGYYDEAHFVRFFKKWTGMLPSQYRKQSTLE